MAKSVGPAQLRALSTDIPHGKAYPSTGSQLGMFSLVVGHSRIDDHHFPPPVKHTDHLAASEDEEDANEEGPGAESSLGVQDPSLASHALGRDSPMDKVGSQTHSEIEHPDPSASAASEPRSGPPEAERQYRVTVEDVEDEDDIAEEHIPDRGSLSENNGPGENPPDTNGGTSEPAGPTPPDAGLQDELDDHPDMPGLPLPLLEDLQTAQSF
ncbi:hypothetical protein OF83DRAFT_1179441, partial [Amylostereum chailletii]